MDQKSDRTCFFLNLSHEGGVILDFVREFAKITGMESTINSRIAMIQLPDTDGHEMRLGSLWLKQPAVLVFLRHYG